MASNGYPSVWYSIITGSLDNAKKWATTYGLTAEHVLYDDIGISNQGIAGGTPTIHIIHSSNMLIWNRVNGWYKPASLPDTLAWYSDQYFPWAADQPGAID